MHCTGQGEWKGRTHDPEGHSLHASFDVVSFAYPFLHVLHFAPLPSSCLSYPGRHKNSHTDADESVTQNTPSAEGQLWKAVQDAHCASCSRCVLAVKVPENGS